MGLVDPGDEVVLIEPCFPMFLDHLKLANAKVKTVPLEFKEETKTWKLNMDLFMTAFSEKTRLFILNNPQNPTGKNLSYDELQQISDILDQYFPHVLVLSDDVYRYHVYDEQEHHLFANFNQNWNKTVSLFDGGKIFSATGWTVGWAIGPQKLIRLGGIIANAVNYCSNVPAQVAMGRSMLKLNEPGYPDY